jgi:predicted kinase
MQNERTIIVITGIMAAGKSTIAHLLVQRFTRGVHIEADALQRMIVSGGQWAEKAGEMEQEVERQLRLRLKNMCLLGRSFFEAGFTVVLDDIILGNRWQHLQEDLQGLPFELVVLAPRKEVVIEHRDLHRAKQPLGETWATYLDENLRATMAGIGHWVDSSALTPEETIAEILQRLSPA